MTPSTFEEIWEIASGVEGWMSHDQAEALFDAAAACPAGGRIVEIGSFRGRSTVVLAAAAPEALVLAIDPHAGTDRGPQEISGFGDAADDDRAAFEQNLERAGVQERVAHIVAFSDRALELMNEPVDVLHIDGAHRYAPARADIRDYGALVADGGVMLIHDSFSSVGVTLAIGRELLRGRRFRYVGRARSLAIYRADLDGPSASNTARQLAQLPWFLKNIGLKLLLTLGLGKVLERLGRPVPEWPY